MNINLNSKLSKYTILSVLATTATNYANSQVVYTDVDPDILRGVADVYNVDVNGDGEEDISFLHQSKLKAGVLIPGNQAILGAIPYTSWSSYWPYALSAKDMISSSVSGGWSSDVGTMCQSFYGIKGHWSDANDKFLGVRFKNLSNQLLYGWIRLDVNTDGSSWTIKDYAYESTPNSGIRAGNIGDVPQVTNIILADISDLGDGRDLQISFDALTDESIIGAYYVVAQKSSDVTVVSESLIQGLAVDRKLEIPKTGANIQVTLAETTLDLDGDLIQNGQTYKIHVYAVGSDSIVYYTSSVTESANTISISGITAEASVNLMASDVSDNFDATDFQVAFDKATDESNITEYKVVIVKSANVLTINEAESNVNSFSISKTGNNISQVLNLGTKDSDGDDIIVGVAYKFYVVSIGENGAGNNISDISNEIILSKPLSFNSNIENDIQIINSNGIVSLTTNLKINDISFISIDGSINILNSGNKKIINISELGKGIYLLKVDTEKGTIIKKIII